MRKALFSIIAAHLLGSYVQSDISGLGSSLYWTELRWKWWNKAEWWQLIVCI